MVKGNILYVMMNGINVGKLIKETNGALQFSYNLEWLNRPGSRPISLSLPLIDKVYKGDEVYNFFDNLLPDSHLIRKRIQARFKIPTNQPFDLLASIGKDCVGAIQFVDEIKGINKSLEYKYLKESEIANLLKNYIQSPLGMSKNEDNFRISIAGAQEKTALLLHNNKWCEPLGETPTTHIFKLPIGYIAHQNLDLSQSCENEYLCSLIAQEFDLPVAETYIENFEDVKALIVKRFDRKYSADQSWIMRLPQEDLCQALGVSNNLKYQSDNGPGIAQIMQLLLNADDPILNRTFFFKAQIFFWLMAAIDGHAKNFSIFLKPGSKYSLTPLYDIISAYPLLANKQLQEKKIKLAMAWYGKNTHYKWDLIQTRHIYETAKLTNFPQKLVDDILQDFSIKVDKVIEIVQKKLTPNFPAHISEPIFQGLRKAVIRI